MNKLLIHITARSASRERLTNVSKLEKLKVGILKRGFCMKIGKFEIEENFISVEFIPETEEDVRKLATARQKIPKGSINNASRCYLKEMGWGKSFILVADFLDIAAH